MTIKRGGDNSVEAINTEKYVRSPRKAFNLHLIGANIGFKFQSCSCWYCSTWLRPDSTLCISSVYSYNLPLFSKNSSCKRSFDSLLTDVSGLISVSIRKVFVQRCFLIFSEQKVEDGAAEGVSANNRAWMQPRKPTQAVSKVFKSFQIIRRKESLKWWSQCILPL